MVMGKFYHQRKAFLGSNGEQTFAFGIGSNSNLGLIEVNGSDHPTNDNSNDSGFGVDFHGENSLSSDNTDKHVSRQFKTMLYKKNFPSYKGGGGGGGGDNKSLVFLDKNLLNIGGESVDNKSVKSSPQYVARSKTQYIAVQKGQKYSPMVSSVPQQQNGDDSNSGVPLKKARFSFPAQMTNVKGGSGVNGGMKLKIHDQNKPYIKSLIEKRILQHQGSNPSLATNLASISQDGSVSLQIISQPEDQHRARYQTEGSRGAIKDRKGNGFPSVRLVGYNKPATLQIFIGNDTGKVSPHMFYQACKVTGKSSTPCLEKKSEGTVIIEIEFEPSKDMTISCDCVGILKERNVDVEQRFPFHHASQSRKKSTKCRMIFRCTILNSLGQEETLQMASQSILCTQPQGLPEISKHSTSQSEAGGGVELFIIGKNFLKDTKVVLQEEDNTGKIIWEARAELLKDYLQQNHLICTIPPYKSQDISSNVNCKLGVWSGGKCSELLVFKYLPNQPNPKLTNNGLHLVHPGCGGSIVGSESLVGSSICSSGGGSEKSETFHEEMTENLIQSDPILPVTSSVLLTHDENSLDLKPNSSPTLSSISDHSINVNVMPPTTDLTSFSIATTTHERAMVNELQSLLDQSAHQQQEHTTQENKPSSTAADGLLPLMSNAPFPSFPPGNELANLLDNNQSEQQGGPQQFQNNPIGQAIIKNEEVHHSMMNCVPVSEILSNFVPISCTTNGSCSLTSNNTGGLIGGGQIQVSPVETTATGQANVTNVINAANFNENSNGGFTNGGGCPPVVSNVPVTTGPVLNMSINEEIQPYPGQGGPIDNVISQMSEHELINYINPNCFNVHSGF